MWFTFMICAGIGVTISLSFLTNGLMSFIAFGLIIYAIFTIGITNLLFGLLTVIIIMILTSLLLSYINKMQKQGKEELATAIITSILLSPAVLTMTYLIINEVVKYFSL